MDTLYTVPSLPTLAAAPSTAITVVPGFPTDASAHGGLEKWSLVNGTWVLDYVLQYGLLNISKR
jgi:hypothetical protein